MSSAADTELEDRVEDAEEGAEQAEDNGVVLEPFNLKRERQEGHFDEGGHYVESKADDEKDPWLSSNGMLPRPWWPYCSVQLSLQKDQYQLGA